MDNSFGARPPWPNQVHPHGYNIAVSTGIDPRLGVDPSMQSRPPLMNGYQTVRPGLTTPTSVGGGYPMWDMDIPSQMFMQAVNFDRMMGSQAPQQPMRDMSSMENSIRTVSNRAGEDQPQRSEAGLDLIEQQQAVEQARLLHRFKELRLWQQTQQEMLMSQQQQQLSQLRKEQDRVQTIISKQRDQQWGGGRTSNFGEMSTPPRRQLPPGMDVSQLMASGLFSHGGPTQQNLSQSRGSLPKPVIYIEPKDDEDDEIKTNPDLFSDTNSNRGSQATVEDGMFPIPDSASEASVDVRGQHYQQPHQPRSQSQHYQQRFNPHELDAPKKLHRSFAELEADEDFINQSYQSPTLLDMQHQKAQHQDKRSGNPRDNEALDKVEESDEEEDDDDEDVDDSEEEDDDDDSDEDDDEDQEDTQIEVIQDSKNLDEIPIKPGLDGTKTFEQLLEEQLRAEEERLKQANMNQDSPTHPKRTFLKKGEGIARFDVKPGQQPPKSKKTQKSNNSSKSNAMQKTATSSQKPTGGSGISQKTTGAGKAAGKPPTQSQSKSSSQTNQKSSSQTSQNKTQKADSKAKKAAPKSPMREKSAPKSPLRDGKKSSTSTDTAQAAGKKTKKAESIPDDASFIANIKERQKESEQDMEELDEFEILEHFADNMSFCSNSSIVTKGLRGLQSDRILTGVLPKTQEVGRPISPRAALIKKLEAEKQANIKQKPLNRQTIHNKTEVEPAITNRKVAHSQKIVSENKSEQNKPADDDDEYESVSESSDDSSDESSEDSSGDDDDDDDNANEKVTKPVGTGDGALLLNSSAHNHKVLVAKGFGDKLKANEDDGKWTNSNRNNSVLSTDKKLERVLSYTGFTETSISQMSDSDQDLDSDDGDEMSSGYDAVQNRSPLKVLTRKVAGRDDRTKLSIPNPQNTGADNSDFLNSSLNASSFAPNAKSPIVISKENVPVQKQNPHSAVKEETKFSYHSDSDSVGNRLKDSFSDDDKSEFGDTEHKSENKKRVSEKKTLQFDDDDEWEDSTPMTVKRRQKHDSGGDTEHNKTLTDDEDRQKSIPDANRIPTTKQSDGTPPTSKLVSKLFPKLKPQQKKQEDQDLQKIQAATQSSVEDGVQSKILRDKLRELDREIEKFRNENNKLTKLRAEREEGLSTLKKEIAEFEKEKSEELRRLEEFKTDEMKKLKHERKMFDKYQKAARAGPDKKEREEIETLKSQLVELQEEMKRKESRWTSNNGRLRTKIDQQEQENEELKAEIKMLEKKRLEWLQKDQNMNKGTLPPSQVPLRSSTPTGEDDMFDPDQQLTNGYTHHAHEQMNDLTSASSIRSNTSLKPSNNPPKINVHSSFPPGTKNQNQNSQPHPSQQSQPSHHKMSNVNQSAKSNLPQNNTKGNQSKKTGTQNSKPGHSVHGQSQNKAGPKAGAKTNTNAARGNQSDKNVLRSSLAEDLPRRVLTSTAAPQDISMYSETEGEVSIYAPTNLPRKFAPRMGVDKSIIDKGDNSYDETQHSDGKVERTYSNGAREILFSNGTRKEISADGKSIVVSFFNGDCKQIMPDQRVVYYYADAQTTHTSYPDGLEIFKFPNQQTEKVYPDGTKEISFPDQTVKYIFPNGSEESIFPDGTVIRLEKNGDKTMEFPNGQREIHTQEYKKREYPDGTVKTVYPDGRQETRYSNGRLRVKDKDGNVIVDRLC